MNPWTDIDAWREFRYDVRHPCLFFRRTWDGARGRNPKVTGDIRWVAIAMVITGVLMMATGIAAIVAT